MFRLVLIVAACVFLMEGMARPQDIEAGRQLYLKYGCAVCHGKEGYGDGPASQRLYSPATNFHRIKSYRVGTTGLQMKDVIIKGFKEEDGLMPAFGHIPEKEVDQIVLFLLSLQEQKHENGN